MPLAQILWQKDAPPSTLLQLSTCHHQLVEERESRQPDPSSHITSNIPPCLGVVRVVVLSWVKMGDPWLPFLDVPMILIAEHASGDVVAKLFNLLADIAEKSVA